MGEFFSNPLHLMLLIVVIVLLFGASKLGDVGGALGKSVREFRKEVGVDDPKPAARPLPPTSSYQAPVVPDITRPVTPPTAGYEPTRPQVVTPGDYRPPKAATPAAPQPPVNSGPPEYRGS